MDTPVSTATTAWSQGIYLNGQKVQEHIGGYLPFNVNLDEYGIQPGDSCLIAVMTDNCEL